MKPSNYERACIIALSLHHTRVEDVIVAQVEDLNVVVELKQVAKLSRVLQTIELVVGQVQLSQVHIHLQSSGCGRQNQGLLLGGTFERRQQGPSKTPRVRVQEPTTSEERDSLVTQKHEWSSRQASILQMEDCQAATDPECSRYKRSRVVQQGSVPCVKILQRARLQGTKQK